MIEKILNRMFILLLGSCPRSGTLGAGVKYFSMGICDGASSSPIAQKNYKLSVVNEVHIIH